MVHEFYTESPAYAIAGNGTHDFTARAVPHGATRCNIQVLFSNLDVSDVKFKVVQSEDNINYDDITDESGITVEHTITHTDLSFTITIVNITSAWIKPQISDDGTVSAGTIDKITINFR